MWVFLSDAALSIVQKPGDKMLTVRARVGGDIDKVFPKAKVIINAGTDYKFRAKVKREDVARAMSDAVMNLDYDNFKSSVKDDKRHDAYLGVWSVMMRYQNQAGGRPKNGRQIEMNSF